MSFFQINKQKNKQVKPVVKTLPVNEAVLEIKQEEFLNWLKQFPRDN